MHDMTVGNLRSAFSGESMAHMRYMVWAEKAKREGFPNVARLFMAISRAEQSHATGHFKALAREAGAFLVPAGGGFGLGSTSANLAGAIEGELFEITEMYPAYLAEAKRQKEAAAVRSMTFAFKAEKIHAKMFTKAKQAVDRKRDVKLGPVHICSVCGHTLEGKLPGKCPVCGAAKGKYESFV